MHTPEGPALKFVVGLDLLPDSQGALEFVAWLHGQGAVSAHAVRGLCILDEGTFFTVHGLARRRIEAGVTEALAGMAAGSTAETALGTLEARIAGPVHRTLGEFAQGKGSVLVIGRQARRFENVLVRLGKTARRLLRHLPVPIVVVPPDLQVRDVPEGPVLVALDLTEESLHAVAYARRYAQQLGRSLRLVHVLPTMSILGLEYLSPAASADLRREHGLRARDAFERFVKEQGLNDLPTSLLPGPVIEAVLEVAAAERACTIVCGARQLSAAARVLSTSVGAEIAARAPVPTALVPPDWSQGRKGT